MESFYFFVVYINDQQMSLSETHSTMIILIHDYIYMIIFMYLGKE